ncbi:hypothetical protein QBC46DRAFT_259899 [Diplogelasinospora grovesii]|uniref:DUF5672 domain-containing protein n=1 Tax=Diplogelasinospora grovesii TaxID=303347 RepID=A0AAN6N867_9PEZI|nr:hypothetical protein QBC46DRAFT_259899 [Diplogelasinospora grovesii]
MEFGTKVAVIIETRVSGNLVPVMLHFMHVLGPGWKMVLYTLESEWILPASTPFRHAVDSRRILIRWLPRNTSFASHHSVSVFLTRPWLWEQLHTADRILMFQRDSILCTNAPQTVDDFLQYDFVGAPIGARHGHGYNGGLSVRNPKLMLSIVTNESLSFDEDAKSGRNQLMFEDQWFYTQMTALGVDRVNLPSPDVARTFAVETIDYDNPLGYHQPDRWQEKNLERIKDWCPEVGMLIAPRYH